MTRPNETVRASEGGTIAQQLATGRVGTPAVGMAAPRPLSAGAAFALPAAFVAILLALTRLPAVRENPHVLWSFLAPAGILLVWAALNAWDARRQGRTLTLSVVLRPQHYVQACAHTSLFIYWGYYWRPVYESAHLIVAQLAFAYAFDILLAWSRREDYTLGFGPFPIIFSTNLFLWFRQDYFYFQFLMVAIGFTAKDLLRWEKDGRQTHIFNPSSFTLAAFSVALLATGMSDITWGKEIASTQFYPPHMYLVLFLVGLPGQLLFGVTSMTMSAVLTTYAFGLLYYAATGTYFFIDSYIPIAVFLGMHLLFTDPSTSPRTELGRIIFGITYGLATVLLYRVLGLAGLPTHYDKLLQVPIMNLSIQAIDRLARSRFMSRFDPAKLGRSLVGRQRNLAYVSVWSLAFIAMSAAGGVGDTHPGQWLPFWQRACASDRGYSCVYFENVLDSYCIQGSAWACNEVGVLLVRREKAPDEAQTYFNRGCTLGVAAACTNLDQTNAAALQTSQPTERDYPIILRGAKGPVDHLDHAALRALACQQGWPGTCGAPSPAVPPPAN